MLFIGTYYPINISNIKSNSEKKKRKSFPVFHLQAITHFLVWKFKITFQYCSFSLLNVQQHFRLLKENVCMHVNIEIAVLILSLCGGEEFAVCIQLKRNEK